MSTEPSNNPAAFSPSSEEQALNSQFKKILGIFGVIVAGLAGYGYYQHSVRVAAEAAAEAFTSAKTADDCDLVVKKHPGTSAAANALLLKATLHWEKNEKSSAIEALKAYLAGHKDHAFYKETLLTLATRLEAMGEKGEAKAAYERVISEQPGTELAQLSQLRLGDMLWADGKEEDAKKAYEEAGTKFPGITAFEGESKTRLEWIAASLPTKEVDPPPAPKPDPKADPKASPALPGMPNIKLNSDGPTLSPTIKLGDAPAMLQPSPDMPAKPVTPVPATVTPPVPRLEVPKSATSPAVQVPAPALTPTPPSSPAPTLTPPPAPPAPAAPAPKP